MLQDLRYQKVKRNREEMLEHLKSFQLEIKPCIGIWSLGASGSRFHEPYFSDKTIEERLEIVARLAEKGLKAVDDLLAVELAGLEQCRGEGGLIGCIGVVLALDRNAIVVVV